MSSDYLHREIDRGVAFSCAKRGVRLLGVMGIQQVRDVTLIRHAYVLTESRRNGIGGELLSCLTKQATNPVLIGTWKVATWAVAFYRKHGFTPVDEETKTRLLRKYWVIPDRQIETSVVLADETWIAGSSAGG
jgi:N-acetylglutamate synthase-like GNAT family acetyltransferase